MARNLKTFENKSTDSGVLIQKVLRLQADFLTHRSTNRTEKKEMQEVTFWKLPPTNKKKTQYRRVNLQGWYIWLRSTLAEALALKFGITATLEAGLGGIQVESDSELLIRTIQGDQTEEAYIMAIVEDIRSMSNIVQCSDFLFTRRDVNKVAHTLARYGTTTNFEQFWMEETTEICNRFISNDVRPLPTLLEK
ncbi:hypothetical protein ACS0TY_016399 [Phlomoides rotata]